MAMLSREQAESAAPQVRRETAPMPSLGGDVTVRGRTLPEALILNALSFEEVKPLPGETDQQMHTRNGARVIAHTLHLQVVLEDDQPMWSVDQWLAHGAAHAKEVLGLYEVAERVSAADSAVALKN